MSRVVATLVTLALGFIFAAFLGVVVQIYAPVPDREEERNKLAPWCSHFSLTRLRKKNLWIKSIYDQNLWKCTSQCNTNCLSTKVAAPFDIFPNRETLGYECGVNGWKCELGWNIANLCRRVICEVQVVAESPNWPSETKVVSSSRDRQSWAVRKLRELRRNWNDGKYRRVPQPQKAMERAMKTGLVGFTGYAASKLDLPMKARAAAKMLQRKATGLLKAATHVGLSVLSGEFWHQSLELATQVGPYLKELGLKYGPRMAMISLAMGVVKALPLMFPEWHARMEDKNSDLQRAITDILEFFFHHFPEWLLLKFVPEVATIIWKSSRWIVKTTVNVIRETPEGIWGVATDLLWLIDGVLVEGLIEFAIPSTERLVISITIDVLLPMVKWVGRELRASPENIVHFLSFSGKVLLRAAKWTAKLPNSARHLAVCTVNEYLLPFARSLVREITVRPNTVSRHFLTISLPRFANATRHLISSVAKVVWTDIVEPTPERVLALLKASVDFVYRGIVIGGPALVHSLRHAVGRLQDAIAAMPQVIEAVGSDVAKLIHWVIMDSIPLLLNGVVLTARVGVPLLSRGIFNCILGTLTVMAAVAAAVGRIVATAARALISFV